MSEQVKDLFKGAQRRARYDEPDSEESAASAGSSPGTSPARSVTLEGTVVPSSSDLLTFEPSAPTERSGVFRAFMARLGLLKPPVSRSELEDRENERIIRQATWTRSVNVLVANRKGASCKTPATIIIAGVLAEIRGGYVAAWESAESPGDLADRAEGKPPRGLTELLVGARLVNSAGNLAGYTAPQTSHAAVIGTVSARDELTPDDVVTVRRLLDVYYHITVTDTANNDQSPTFLAALDTADAVLVPCAVNLQSVRGVQRAVQMLAHREARHVRGLKSRVVVVVSHDGGPEDPILTATVVEGIRRNLGVRAVVEVPFDPAIRRDGEITLAHLSPASRLAWRQVARHLVEALQDAPEQSPIPVADKEH